MWTMALLAGISTPMMLIGIAGVIAAALFALYYHANREDKQIGTEAWIVNHQNFKYAFVAILMFACLGAVGYGIPQEGWQTKTVTVEKKVSEYPKFDTLYENCMYHLESTSENHKMCVTDVTARLAAEKQSETGNASVLQMIPTNTQQIVYRDRILYKIPKLADLFSACMHQVDPRGGGYTDTEAMKQATDNCQAVAERQYNIMQDKYKQGAR